MVTVTMKQLRELAKEKNIRGRSKMSREELISALDNYDPASDAHQKAEFTVQSHQKEEDRKEPVAEPVAEQVAKKRGNVDSLRAFSEYLKTFRTEHADQCEGKSYNEIRKLASAHRKAQKQSQQS